MDTKDKRADVPLSILLLIAFGMILAYAAIVTVFGGDASEENGRKLDCLMEQMGEHRESSAHAHEAAANSGGYSYERTGSVPKIPDTLQSACDRYFEPSKTSRVGASE